MEFPENDQPQEDESKFQDVQDHTHRAEQEVDDMDDDMPSDSMNDSEILSSDGGTGFDDHAFG